MKKTFNIFNIFKPQIGLFWMTLIIQFIDMQSVELISFNQYKKKKNINIFIYFRFVNFFDEKNLNKENIKPLNRGY